MTEENRSILDSLDMSHGETRSGRKLDLGSGPHPRPGYEGVDRRNIPEVEHVLDLMQAPWPFEDDSIAAVWSHHFVEHIPHYVPGYDNDGWWLFFSELYRVLEPDGIAEIVHPYHRSDRAFYDPTHTRYIAPQTWDYMSVAGRERLGAQDGIDVDFGPVFIQTLRFDTQHLVPPPATEAEETFLREYSWNVVDDLFVVLRAQKG